MKIAFIFLATLLSFSAVQAGKSKSYCACQTGQWPENQVAFFKAGCQLWLSGQSNCSESIIVPQEEGVDALPAEWDGALVKFGYVGHWSAYNTSRFLQEIHHDGVVKRNMSFEVDNTACNGMEYPDQVSEELRSFSYPEGKYIKFKANQVLSVGMWDPVLIGKSNLWAEADSRTSYVKYPRCEEFEKQACTDLGFGVQESSGGGCRTPEGDVRQLTCCRLTVEATKLTPGKDREPQKTKVSGLFWATEKVCSQGHF